MFSELLSHPNKLLKEHLLEVAVQCQNITTRALENSRLSDSVKNNIIKTSYLIGAFHDIGKANGFFQDYIRNPQKVVNSDDKSHSILSAFFAYWATIKLFNQKDNNSLNYYLPLFAFTSVKRHHGNLQNFTDELCTNNDTIDLIKKQIKTIDEKSIQNVIDELLNSLLFKLQWIEFSNSIDEIKKELNYASIKLTLANNSTNNTQKTELFYIHQLLYSSLLYADRYDVVFDDMSITPKKEFYYNKIQDYRSRMGFENPESEKNIVYHQTLDNFSKIFNQSQHFYSITLPTGYGKTILSLAVAEKIKEYVGASFKIVICLPFTSIIDQNHKVFEDIVGNDCRTLIKHHHLSEPLYKTSEADFSYTQSSFLIETWNSDIVVTTFVQFIELLIRNDKSKLLKFSNLANSIIILDEVQAINHDLWEAIRIVFKQIAELMNCYFILMSATQPLIFKPNEEIIEIVPDYSKYFKKSNRTRLVLNHNETITEEDFLNNIVKYCTENPSKDVLIILNTIKSCLSCFNYLREHLSEDYNLYYLSTLITPYERKQIIRFIKNKPDHKPDVIVSTQLIEAGVDISVDTVFRVICPLDSIIQSAGRANRYFEKKTPSDVFVYDVEEYKNGNYAVYGAYLMIKTLNTIKHFSTKEIEERDFLKLIELYFKKIYEEKDETSKRLEQIKNLEFASLADFSLIESRTCESVYIQLNSEAKEIWEEYLKIFNDETLNYYEKEEKFARIKSKFYDYVINVPLPYGQKTIDFDSEKIGNFYVSHLERPSRYYSYNPDNFRENTGYRINNDVIYL